MENGALPQSEYSVKHLTLPEVIVYDNLSDYRRKTGKEAPAYDPNRRLKNWVDTRASDPASTRFFVYQSLKLVGTYKVALDHNGRPEYVDFGTDKQEAGEVNFLPAGPPGMIPQHTRGSYPIPQRPLFDDEGLRMSPFSLTIVNLSLQAKQVNPTILADTLQEILRLTRETHRTVHAGVLKPPDLQG